MKGCNESLPTNKFNRQFCQLRFSFCKFQIIQTEGFEIFRTLVV